MKKINEEICHMASLSIKVGGVICFEWRYLRRQSFVQWLWNRVFKMYKIVEYQINCIDHGFSLGHDDSIAYRTIVIIMEIVEKKDNENTA